MNRRHLRALALTAIVVAGCSTVAPAPSPETSAAASGSTGPGSAGPAAPADNSQQSDGAPGSVIVTPRPSGFAFDAADVADYYRGVGFSCSEGQPSPSATGMTIRTCRRIDAGGRTLTIRLSADQTGGLVDGVAGVEAPRGTSILQPADALDHLSGFLGAMLGSDRAGRQLEWLAGHLGDARAETTDGGLRIATYTPDPQDHTAIYLELNPAN
jgi:hypothetical protein